MHYKKLIKTVVVFLSLVTLTFGQNIISSDYTKTEVKRQNYESIKEKIEKYRKQQQALYQNASDSKKAEIVRNTQQYLQTTLVNEIAPAWYGTTWAFHGTSTKPGQGTIACGYFVSTCLVHMGFEVNRIKLAQQPSQRIIETFMSKKDRDILKYQLPMEKVRKYLKDQGDGIYIVGLDTHVGFVSVYEDDMAFIHSTYYNPPRTVVSEVIESKNPLSDSKYRVFGKIFEPKMVAKWLNGHEFKVKTQ